MSFNHTGTFTSDITVYLETDDMIEYIKAVVGWKITQEMYEEFLAFHEECGEIEVFSNVEYEFGSKSGAECTAQDSYVIHGFSPELTNFLLSMYADTIEEKIQEACEELSPDW